MRQLFRSLVLASLLAVGVSSVASASTILQFQEVTFNTPFSLMENGTNTATTLFASGVPINVAFDQSFCLHLGCDGAINGIYALTISATSTGPATLTSGIISEPFSGSLSITQGLINLLTVNFTDTLSGSQFGSSPVLQASQPPDSFTGSSNILDPTKFGVPRGFSFSFSNLAPGGLAINGTSIAGGERADATGTFSVTPQASAVPEPGSLILLGSGLLFAARKARSKMRA